jgi:nucleoside-diphosphate kinase
MSEYTLIFLKPSAVKRGLVGEILSRFERKGFEIAALKMVKMDRDTAERFYEVHRGKHFFEDLINAVSDKYIVAAILRGREAVRVVRNMIGSTDPVDASPGSIRGDYGLDITDNIIHASDSIDSFNREARILFPEFFK